MHHKRKNNQMESIAKDRLLEVAKIYTPSKFLMWIEENYSTFDDSRLEIEILNKDEVFNLNVDTVKLKVENRIFIFTNGVFQNVLDSSASS